MKNKEEEALFAGRIRDLARQAGQNDYLTHTGFLSLSEQARADAVLRDEGTGYSRPLFYGGNREADRKVLLFLPSYMEAVQDVLRGRYDNDPGAVLVIVRRAAEQAAREGRQEEFADMLIIFQHFQKIK